MNVTPEDAYREACLALGESIVAQRFMGQEMGRLASENARLTGLLETRSEPTNGEPPGSPTATHASGCAVPGSASYGRETPIACTCGAE